MILSAGEYDVSPEAERIIGHEALERMNQGDADLLAMLGKAEAANMHARDCQVCEALAAMSDQARAGVQQALAGTIGERRLADILTRSGYPTGRRAVANHRREAHTP